MVEQTSPAFTWLNPTRVVFGVGELSRLPAIVDEVAGTGAGVFLVTGRRSLRAKGVLQEVVDSLGASRVTLFDRVAEFPSPGMVVQALAACRRSSADAVVAIGGGSAMDVGKSVAILMTHGGDPEEYGSGQKKFHQRGLPFIAVPTTSGSSSEVTAGVALWDMEAKRPIRLSSPFMFPTVAIVDPRLSMSMPKILAAATGMDAFTSAFESYWSLKAEPLSDAIALEVIRILEANLERSCIQGDLESRSMCALAATMSGIGYSNSPPNVCHAIGSPLTLFWEVAHGQAVSVTLPTFLRWSAPAISHKLPALWSALGVGDVEEATARIDRMMERCGLQSRLRALGVGDGDMETLLEHTPWERVELLPRPVDREDVGALLEELL